MATSTAAFRKSLYAEHLEEIGFLHAQRCGLQAAPGSGWQAPAAFEERLEAHLDALVVGSTSAVEFCRQRLSNVESPELFGITALACRQTDLTLIRALLADDRLDDAAARSAIAGALLQEWPTAWGAACVGALAQGDLRLAPVFAAIAATRGFAAGNALVQALGRCASAEQSPLLAWVGLVQGDTPAWLATAYDDANPARRAAALRAGLRLHDDEARRRVLCDARHPELIAMCSGRDAAGHLLNQLQGYDCEPALVDALGQLGELSAVRPLTAMLSAEPLAAAAANALHLITGADLLETVLVPEPIREEELTEAELKLWREAGEAPRRVDNEPFGERIERLSRNPAAWVQWLVDNGSRFVAGRRYRLGQPCSADMLLRSLGSPWLAAGRRESLAEELQVRHGIKLAWHLALPVRMQWVSLRKAIPAAQAHSGTVGDWYWAGQSLP